MGPLERASLCSVACNHAKQDDWRRSEQIAGVVCTCIAQLGHWRVRWGIHREGHKQPVRIRSGSLTLGRWGSFVPRFRSPRLTVLSQAIIVQPMFSLFGEIGADGCHPIWPREHRKVSLGERVRETGGPPPTSKSVPVSGSKKAPGRSPRPLMRHEPWPVTAVQRRGGAHALCPDPPRIRRIRCQTGTPHSERRQS